jgi:3-deoxy-D-manno-octulosonate 8-phosphate phosphatase (KDO 8-P phosphatase)
MQNFKQKLAHVKALIFDIDGVLTDGSVTLMPDGEQLRRMNIKDGYALQLAVKKGFKVAVISGGRSESARARLNGLGITDVYLSAGVKLDVYENYLLEHDLSDEQVLYMGDDIPDYDVMKRAGVPVCPNDASQEIKAICLYTSARNGGEGCVRDIIEQVMRVQDKWFDNESINANFTV